jgi:hypothetical protein
MKPSGQVLQVHYLSSLKAVQLDFFHHVIFCYKNHISEMLFVSSGGEAVM